MPEDTLKLTIDPGNSFDVLNRIGGATDRLGQRGEEIGRGFIRGDRAVRVATQSITQSLLTANNAADATLATFAALERVFKIPLAGTIGAAAGIAGAAALRAEFKKTQDTVDALRQNLRVPISIEIALSPEDIASRVDELRKTTDALEKRSSSFGEKVARFFAPAASGGMSSGRTREAEQTKLIAEGEREIFELERARADKLLQIAGLKLTEGDLDKAELTFEQKRASLLEESVKKGGNTLNLYKQLLAAQIDVEVAARKKAKEDEKTLDAAKKTTAELEKQNALLKAAPQTAEQKKAQEIQESDRAVANARADQQRIEDQQAEEKRAADQKKSDTGELQKFGRILSPQERLQASMEDQATERQKNMDAHDKDVQQKIQDQMEEQLRGISPEQLKNERDFNKSRGKEGVSALADQDFSGIASLANQDFSGIASLGGLSISIA